MIANAFGPFFQVAYMVEDIDSSTKHWSEIVGVGPWTIYRNVGLKAQWRGQDTDLKINVGLSYRDGLQVELIQPVSKAISPYQHDDGRIKVGMHHMAWTTQDFERDLAKAKAQGLTQVFAATNSVTKVAYFEAPNEPGVLIEMIEVNDQMQAGFDQGIAASRAWDGRERILMDIDFGG
jgi:hypothetical protein